MITVLEPAPGTPVEAPDSARDAHRSGPVRDALVERIHAELVSADPVEWSALTSTEQRERLVRMVRVQAPLLDAAATIDVVERVVARVAGLGPLEPLLDDTEVTEVMVNGDGSVWIERRGQVLRTGLELDEQLVLLLIERVVAPLGRRIDRSSPVVDARLADGSRVNAVVPPAAVDGPCLTVRRFGARRFPLESFGGAGVSALLRWAVGTRRNLVVSGGTGSGKTSLLNALASAIPAGQRIITIEDTAELRLSSDHVVRLEARAANAEGTGALPVRELLRNALRMRPDRIVVGEVRGDEVVDMLAAMNTGHEGSLSTVHANSPPDALRRLETMVLVGASDIPAPVARDLVDAAVDLVVQVARASTGSRVVRSVHEIVPLTDGAPAPAHGSRAARSTGRTRALVEDGVVRALPCRPGRGLEQAAPLHEWIGT